MTVGAEEEARAPAPGPTPSFLPQLVSSETGGLKAILFN